MKEVDRARQPETDVFNEAQVARQLGERALSIGVFCSARDLSETLTEPARELARLIGEQGHDLVWGASDIGAMHVISSEARLAGAKIIGITTESLSKSQHKSADEMIIAKDLSERKMILVERSDALVVLPGGTGTLDEVADVIERKKFGHHYKAIIFLNSGGFYDGLKAQFDRMESEGLLNRPVTDIVNFVSTPKAAMDLMENKQSEHMREILTRHDMVEHAEFTAGHSGALLYRTRSTKGERFVIKVSNDKTSSKEVKSNLRAYKGIQEAGLASVVPKIINGEDSDGRKYIVMPDLGETFTEQARSEVGVDYGDFLSGVGRLLHSAIRSNDRPVHTESLSASRTALKEYQASLKVGGLTDQQMLDTIDAINLDDLVSERSSFFLLDFTPDNVFVHGEQVQFIDPWEQPTFRGSPIPNLAQFQTLARDIYNLPGAKDADKQFEEMFGKMAEALNLTEEKMNKQRLLGSALQYSLSAFTRMNSIPEEAQEYYQQSVRAVSKLVA